MTFGKTTPILRIFDEAKAREFYVDFLGFTVDWDHRFEANTPLYMHPVDLDESQVVQRDIRLVSRRKPAEYVRQRT